MENILTLNQSIFGTKTKERRISRRAVKASVQELYVPQESEEITYDEGYDIDGAWEWNWGAALTCVAAAATLVAGVFAGSLVYNLCVNIVFILLF